MASEEKLKKFFENPSRYANASLPVKMPAAVDPVHLFQLRKSDGESITFLQQAIGSIITRALREVGENRLKYPTLTVKETMLKMFALCLKADNPANTKFMKEKYMKKLEKFISRCEIPEELSALS